MAFAVLAPLFLLAAVETRHELTADEAMRNYHAMLKPVRALDCPRDEEIVVCGRKGPDPNRPPIPYEREPGESLHLIPGEPPNADPGSPCLYTCPVAPPGGIRNMVKGIIHLLGKDD